MSSALRLQAVTLPVPDLAAAEKFYRWVLAMKESAEGPVAGVASLGWGKEDRVRLVDAEASPEAREAIEFRMEARDPVEMAAWLAERELVPTRVLAFVDDQAEMHDTWPNAQIQVDPDSAGCNRFVVSLEAPVGVRIDLHVPLPSSTVVERGRHGPFYRRSKDWRGLENPGLLGATLGAADSGALAGFLASLGIAEMAEKDAGAGAGAGAISADADAPLLAGDHQIRIEERDPPGIYGAAYVVAAPRLPDLVRTLERFGAQHRHDRNHLLAVDPAGRILAINGVRSG
ncbi:MAG TPA: VOC family protein [Gemmatimonadota bacterium]|nr:VOC family protein [Gemmatimonadota bacterium]